MKALLLIAVSALTMWGCASRHASTAAVAKQSMPEARIADSHLPRAVIYKVAPKYADKVPVTMNAGKTKMIGFPAPTDISEFTSPIAVAEGYLLDRQGVGVNTMFLVWTREEYAAFEKTPMVSEIKEAIDPQSYVMVVVQLPMEASQAAADTAAVNHIIRGGLKDCKVINGKPIQFGQPVRTIGTIIN